MSNHTRGRYAAPRKPRTRSFPFYLLAALATGLLLLAGACADTEADAPDDFPVNAERRSDGDAAPELDPEPVVDEPAMSDDEIFQLAMDMTFESMSATEMADVCLGLDLLGMDASVSLIAEGWGSGWQSSYEPLVADKLRALC